MATVVRTVVQTATVALSRGVRELDLAGKNLTPAECTLLADALARNSTLTSLGLARNGIDSDGAKAIADMLVRNSTLTSLGLASNGIGPDGAKVIADVLARNSTLTSLDLWGNGIGDNGANALEAIAQVLNRNKEQAKARAQQKAEQQEKHRKEEENRAVEEQRRKQAEAKAIAEAEKNARQKEEEHQAAEEEGECKAVEARAVAKAELERGAAMRKAAEEREAFAQLLIKAPARFKDFDKTALDLLEWLTTHPHPYKSATSYLHAQDIDVLYTLAEHSGFAQILPVLKTYSLQIPNNKQRDNSAGSSHQRAARHIPYAELDGFGQKPIASGAHAEIYRILHLKSNTLYAAKLLKVTEGELDENTRREFEQEAALLATLRDPHIVQFIGLSRDPEGRLILLNEYMAGGGLHKWLYSKKHGFEPKVRLRLALEIACGLSYLHACNIMHRDLKSDNILLDEDGLHARIADFGLAKLASSQYQDTAVGTLMYRAPEILREEKYTEAADVYSFALTIFELYTAQRPYPINMGGNLVLLRQHVATQHQRPQIPSTVPASICEIMQRCWHPEPKQRPAMKEVVEALRKVTISP